MIKDKPPAENPFQAINRTFQKVQQPGQSVAAIASATITKDKAIESIKQERIKGPKEKARRDAEIVAYAQNRYRVYRSAGQSVTDARSTVMVDVGDDFKNKKGEPVTRGRSWIIKYLKD